MTENNAAQPGLTDDEIRDIITNAHQSHGAFKTGYGLALGRAIESALLSKLRAEGVQAGEPVADERCKRCGGPGWYTSHTTGYPESIPCSACNPQGVSVEQLENDPFLAAQLWRKSADAEGSPLERILEHVSEYGESMASSTLLSVRSIARRNVETRIAAELAALASAPVAGEAEKPVAEVVSRYGDPEAFGERDLKVLVDLNSYPYGAKFYAAPQASEAVRNADQDEMERLGWVNIGYKHDLEKARRAISFCNIPGFDTMSLDNAIYWLRANADKDGGDCAKSAGENLLDYAMAIAHERELDVLGHKHNSDEAVDRFKAAVDRALPSTPSVVKQSLTATQTGEKGESDE
ncbi:hypothetical protein [Achromobacter spanius]|uniref:Uncharacterized protein n=1 Tax=Achromobacter spanius TaxID=217203 RepID=A0AAW3I8C0_9BURK|nr:hypothetical protein [Achromobacter spanius]KNE28142.1 hypothetical protein AFM18_08190 [Achromobacter spanius]